MLIVCPNCATSYRVVAENLGEVGRSVRCVNCHHVWFEEPRHPEPEATAFSSAAGASGDRENPVWASIRPPLNDVVDMGSTVYSQPQSGEAERDDIGDANSVNEPRDARHAAIEAAEGAPSSTGPRKHGSSDAGTETSVERIAARRGSLRARPRRRLRMTASTALTATICVLILTLGGLVALRQQVVRVLPQTAQLYAGLGLPVNLRGLRFDNIKTVRETQDGVPVLVVEGDIIGTGARLTEVPRLRFAVLDRAGKEIYAWTARPDRSLLPPGETLPFRSRLASPPAEASGVTVRFFNRHDAQAGFM